MSLLMFMFVVIFLFVGFVLLGTINDSFFPKTLTCFVAAIFWLVSAFCLISTAQIHECFNPDGNRALCFMFEIEDGER